MFLQDAKHFLVADVVRPLSKVKKCVLPSEHFFLNVDQPFQRVTSVQLQTHIIADNVFLIVLFVFGIYLWLTSAVTFVGWNLPHCFVGAKQWGER